MNKEKAKRLAKLARHQRVRKKVSGTTETPRLCVYRSLKNIYVQLIDDAEGVTLASASTLSPECRGGGDARGVNIETAKRVGKVIADKALGKGIDRVIFDKNCYRYHGKVRALAEAAREGGLKF